MQGGTIYTTARRALGPSFPLGIKHRQPQRTRAVIRESPHTNSRAPDRLASTQFILSKYPIGSLTG